MRAWDMLMITALAGGALLLAGAKISSGGQRLSVPLPDVSAMNRTEADMLARQLAEIEVITANCPDYVITDGEWTLLSGTGDLLAAQIGVDPTQYERDYFGPAFTLLDDPSSCDRIGPEARPLIDRLIRMGGGTKLQR
ncbi:hypothetical protein [Paracoccus sp. (in: a-proteobacteria)]|uniref:hypothetical protein n=1 Tax=Paracoccus sp. TaxID=267 RepID=UPI004058C3D9